MELLNILRKTDDGSAIAKLGERAGLSQIEADAVIEKVLPEFSHRIERNTFSRGGLADLLNLIDSADHEAVLDNPDLAGSEAARTQGKMILNQIIGTKHGSRTIASRAAADTGISAATIERMMPEIAALSLGGLQRKTASQFGDILSQMPNRAVGGDVGEQRPLPVPNGPPGGGGWGSGDWQPGQEIPQYDEWFRDNQPREQRPSRDDRDDNEHNYNDRDSYNDQSPLPLPGEARDQEWGQRRSRQGGGGFRDLSDILRRQGGGGSSQGGSSLGRVIRQIFGSALGFKNGGIVSWIIRIVLFRVAWPILRRMLFGR